MNYKNTLAIMTLWCSTLGLLGQSLDHFLQLGYENNPELKAIQLQYEASLQQADQAGQLPNLTIGMGFPYQEVETRLGKQSFMISAAQMFPFGATKSKENIMLSMAKGKYEKIVASRLELTFEIKRIYYNLCFTDEKQKVIENNIRIYESLEKVALSKVESGKTILSDVLRIQIKVEELKTQLKLLDEQKYRLSAQISAVTNSQSERIVEISENLKVAENISFDIENYRNKIKGFHPLIKQIDWQIEASNEAIKLNEKKRKPSIGIGVDYSIIEERTDANPINNGRDVIIPKLMLSFPLEGKRFKAKKEEEHLKVQAFNLKKQDLENKMISRIKCYKSDYESAVLMSQLAKKQIVISKSAFEILLSEYSGNGLRFDELMKLQNEVLKHELQLIKSTIQSHMAKINIDRLTDF